MSYKTFKPGRTDYLNQPMFFGDEVSTARYDQQTYPIFESLIEKQLSFFWRPEEINISEDRGQYNQMTAGEKHLFDSNLKYQTLLDSIQGRSPNLAFLPICSVPEVETWIESWAFSECLAEGTEVLTVTGWKDLKDVTIEDSCLVYDLDDGTSFFERPKRVVEYDMDTQLVEYKAKNSKQFHQFVTPNHRMPVVHRQGERDLHHKRVSYFKEAILQDYQSHHLAPISGMLRSTEGQSKVLEPIERLLIAIQADGTVSDHYTGERCGTIPVWFNLTKERKIIRLETICQLGGFELTELTDDSRNNSKRLKVSVPVELLGDIDPKTFSWVKLDKISSEWASEFLNEVSYWDSHRFGEEYTSTFTYTTGVKQNADIVQALSSLCGRSPRLSVRVDDRKASYSDMYSVNVICSAYKDGQSIERTLRDYKGKVRCLETSTGAFAIRYNGAVSITGNTIHSRSYTHILRNVVNRPEIILDDITVNENIIKRASQFTTYYDDVIQFNAKRMIEGPGTPEQEREHKKALLRALCSVNALEAIAFYVSFACSFAFAERDKMEGNAKIISLIAR